MAKTPSPPLPPTETSRSPGLPGWVVRRPFLPALLLVVAVGALFRFYAIGEIGLRGDDTLYYLSLLRGWAAPLHEHYRVVAMGVYAFVYQALGYADWSIKSLNALLDTLNILLTFAAGTLIARSAGVGLAAAAAHALSPRMISFSRTELLHSGETFCLLAAIALFAFAAGRADRRLRLPLFTLSGCLAATAFGVHEDSLLFSGGFFLFLGLSLVRRWDQAFDRVLDGALFALGFVATLSLLGFWGILSSNRSGVGLDLARLPDFYLTLPSGLILLNMSYLAYYAFFASLLFWAVHLATPWLTRLAFGQAPAATTQADGAPGLAALPYLMIGIYLVLYPFMISSLLPETILPRLFLPGVPLAYIGFFTAWSVLTRKVLPGPAGAWAFGIGACLVVASLFVDYPASTREMDARLHNEKGFRSHFFTAITVPKSWQDRLRFRNYPISGYRRAADILRGRVDAEHRLLVLPYTASYFNGERAGFRHYFGDDAAYIYECQTDILDYIRQKKVRYVTVASFHIKATGHTREVNGRCYGIPSDKYEVKLELSALDRVIHGPGFRPKLMIKVPDLYLIDLDPIESAASAP